MFTKTLLNCKQLKCPQTGKWIIKIKYIYTMKCYLAIKRNMNEPQKHNAKSDIKDHMCVISFI